MADRLAGARQQHTEEVTVSAAPTPDSIEQVLRPAASGMGLDLEDVAVSTAGRRRLLRVVVDKDGGVTLDDVAEATRELSRELDGTEVMGEQPYTLEVEPQTRGGRSQHLLDRVGRGSGGHGDLLGVLLYGAGQPIRLRGPDRVLR